MLLCSWTHCVFFLTLYSCDTNDSCVHLQALNTFSVKLHRQIRGRKLHIRRAIKRSLPAAFLKLFVVRLSRCKLVMLSFSHCSPTAWHWINIRLSSRLISTDCSLHSLLKQHWKVISSLRTWLGPPLLPTHDPPGQHIVERGNMVGKLKERNYNSLNVRRRAGGGVERERRTGKSKEVWKGRPRDILLWGIPGPGLVNSLKLVFGVSDPNSGLQ